MCITNDTLTQGDTMNVHVLVITIDHGYGDVEKVVQGVFVDPKKAHDEGLRIVRDKTNYDFSVDTHCLQ